MAPFLDQNDIYQKIELKKDIAIEVEWTVTRKDSHSDDPI
jgi:hypothetical protein